MIDSNLLIQKNVFFNKDEVKNNWNCIVESLSKQGITDDLSLIAAAATIAVEAGKNCKPISEYGNKDYFRKYDNRQDLGNTKPGFGYRYRGRGYIQLTGYANYKKYGDRLSIDLVNQPDLANNPKIAADIFATYFKDHGIDRKAQAKDWRAVRRAVNGGLNGYPKFITVINSLLADLQ